MKRKYYITKIILGVLISTLGMHAQDESAEQKAKENARLYNKLQNEFNSSAMPLNQLAIEERNLYIKIQKADDEEKIALRQQLEKIKKEAEKHQKHRQQLRAQMTDLESTPLWPSGISTEMSDSYPFKVDFYSDGGTQSILQRASEEAPEKHYCLNNEMGSDTRGELYEGAPHPTKPGAVKMDVKDGEALLKRIEAKLKQYHGEEEYKHIVANPVQLNLISRKEYDRKRKDSKFIDRLITDKLVSIIKGYRSIHTIDGKIQSASVWRNKFIGDWEFTAEIEEGKRLSKVKGGKISSTLSFKRDGTMTMNYTLTDQKGAITKHALKGKWQIELKHLVCDFTEEGAEFLPYMGHLSLSPIKGTKTYKIKSSWFQASRVMGK